MTGPSEPDVDGGGPHLGRAVRLARTARGLKRREVAQRTGLSYPYLSQVERGVRRPSTRVIQMIADALDMAAADLLASAQQVEDAHATGAVPAVAEEVAPRAPAPVALGPRWISTPTVEDRPATGVGADTSIRPGPDLDTKVSDKQAAVPSDEDIERLVRLAKRLSRDDVVLLVDFAKRLLP